MINNVVLVGRMTRDAELRYTPSANVVATFTLAVNRNLKTKMVSGKRTLLTVLFGANKLKIWRIGLKRCADWCYRSYSDS